MSRDGRQRERERGSERDRTDADERDADGRSRGSRGRMPVSDRTSWSGLAKRAYNVIVSDAGRSRDDSGGALKLAGLTIAGAFLAGLLPLPFTWLVGLGVGAAVGGWAGEGSPLLAVGNGAVIGFVFGLAFAPALFGLGFLLTLVLSVVGALVAGAGYLAGE
ncbi:hypothetical protein RYH80_04125 [Halobaculum sp. MBLA0147]|uniref:hypothetical protein n=1 Tax=Halobaculum sp. MBLA0147 TaxID=3079934 RepID=UPI0035268A51